MTITIKLSLPHKSLSPNGRAHWACKAREAGKQHSTAHAHSLAEGLHLQGWKSATMDVAWFAKTRRYLPDDDNAWASLKHARDGIAKAMGIDDKAIRQGQFVAGADKANPRVEITIRAKE